MISILLAAAFGLILSLVGTPLFTKLLVRQQYGQFIREDGPTSHQTKRGTPTMGGVVIIVATLLAFFLALAINGLVFGGNPVPSVSALLLLFLMIGMAGVGFIDDFKKIARKQSLGLTPKGKILLQGTVGIIFGVLALTIPNENGWTPASTHISFTRDIPWLDLSFGLPILGIILFVVWANLISTATTNAVNLTDGLDGLATGASILVFSGYLMISMWQANHLCESVSPGAVCYEVRDPAQLSVVAAALVGALIGFLWWNTSPATIFMGDTGSLGLGGALAAFAMLTRTEILLVLLAGLFVMISASVIIQVGYFKISGGKRVFKMAPLQHHFELKGWKEVTVVVRFWIIAGLFVALALGVFYGDWLISHGGVTL
ncbi:phospho-N-acetylmuramoyl-pentapeptide-transferase [Rothia sp. HC945]|uniref:phospho-N-acetylmuramoyl-pentapeptide- transferase n=1 Tax=Rothia sp. HC945 TaxID=3171170 RepID=UPI0026537D6D|nr:phospho-N-acetylmuramoyl-pentapeptide-transferase [Kocuria sp.]MDN5616695.1 phospho-N-acetylmuramoyl-pentapeptide-transferase [Kocuria sp.]MDN5655586.1 phospho-N-acetylmuramoyl-pentapeptide-transferase [Kocuria sp.]